MMQSYLCLTIRFLQPYYHGRGDNAEPEWPPSPLRLFQALLAAAARLGRDGRLGDDAIGALHWIEERANDSAPTVVASGARAASSKYRTYVPDNTGDLAAGAWCRGDTTRIISRTEKDVRPMCLSDPGEVHYLFPLADGQCPHEEVLRATARSVTHLGWGIDMVAADASLVAAEDDARLDGEVWLPVSDTTGNTLRVPIVGTLDALIAKHGAFLKRIGRDERGNETFNPVPPLTRFRVVGYRRATDPTPRRIAAFALLRPDASAYRAFDAARRGLTVAGMMRSAAKRAAEKSRPDENKWRDEFVLGHGENHDEPHRPVGPRRFAYLPLPSIESRGPGRAGVVGPIRRVLVAVLAEGHEKEIDWAGQAMSGMQLTNEQQGEPRAVLSRLPASDGRIQRYTSPSSNWATVTPVVLPGYDDRRRYRRRLKDRCTAENQRQWLGKLDERIDSLIRKAFRQAGYSETLAKHAVIDWRDVGFWAGTELASRYGVPDHLKGFPRYHVRIQWRDAAGQPVDIPGPICIGGGRFYGLGLLASQS
ncbi:MAG: type I-U CRISPR-associated protein Cas5/Cas6 [Pirellulaceae bacterium]|nr:type I-U CRISPR-associated protein Cas5/Cas6 [Pirellulaceae bacterium]